MQNLTEKNMNTTDNTQRKIQPDPTNADQGKHTSNSSTLMVVYGERMRTSVAPIDKLINTIFLF